MDAITAMVGLSVVVVGSLGLSAIDPAVFKAMLTADGGETANDDDGAVTPRAKRN